ncbi:MAG: Spy/CpxP family protein refolding chaperone [Azoarcus sp.]|nr:Spy/CpxP family protein refolding chaperone [Azoarcus sp.]
MKPWIKASLVAALAASTLLGGLAAAHGERGHGWDDGGHAWRGAPPGQVKEHLSRQMELQLARLELALSLTPEQKPVWSNFKKAITARGETVWKEAEARQKAERPRTVLENLQRAEEVNKQHARLLADTRKDVETLYGKLSDAQKTVFDAEADKFLSHHRHGNHRHGDRKEKRRGRD